jgi:hypothetical protein
MPDTLEQLLSFCRKKGRVCPLPQRWNDLYRMLPKTQRRGTGWEPALPLILAAWWEASDRQKRERLELHIRWAHDNGALDQIANFLRSLPESEWHHAGE